MRRKTPSRKREHGSAAPAALATVGLAGALALSSVSVGERLLERAQAQTAADFAALAGVVEGRDGAADLAARNGASLLLFVVDEGDVHVVVRLGSAQAEAWATRRPRQP